MKNSKVYDRPIKPFPEYVQKDITYKLHTLLLALLRPTITPSILQPNILNLSEEDWTRLFTLAAQHGVTALLFDTILRLPEQQQPSRALKIRWALSSEAIEKRHAQQTRAAHELTTLFASHGVRTILLKGLGLSIYYPRPEHRECGDIDLWLDNCDKGNRLTRIGRKTRKLFSCRWKYRTLLPENFWRDVILPSLLFHLKNPKNI